MLYSHLLLARAGILPLEFHQEYGPWLVRIDTAKFVKTLTSACHHDTEPTDIGESERWDIERAIHAVLGVSLAKCTTSLEVKLKCRVRKGKRGVEHRVSRKAIVFVHNKNTGRGSRNRTGRAQSSRRWDELAETPAAAEGAFLAFRTDITHCKSQDQDRR